MKKEVKIGLGLFIGLLVIFTLFDLKISETLFNPESKFGWFFEAFGEIVLSFIGLFSASVLFKTQKEKVIPMRIVYGLLIFFYALMSAGLNKAYLHLSLAMMIILIFIYIGIAYYLTRWVTPQKEELVRKIAKVGILTTLLPILLITVLKMIWGRQRFVTMVDPSREFTPWYAIQGFTTNNNNMSFPSGHSANSSTIIWLTLLPLWIEKLKPYTKILNVAAYLWIVCVMLSRVIMGAHFSTDVLCGSMISLSLFYWLKNHYLKNEDITIS